MNKKILSCIFSLLITFTLNFQLNAQDNAKAENQDSRKDQVSEVNSKNKVDTSEKNNVVDEKSVEKKEDAVVNKSDTSETKIENQNDKKSEITELDNEVKDFIDDIKYFELEVQEYKKGIQFILERQFKDKKDKITKKYKDALVNLENKENQLRIDAIEQFKRFIEKHPNNYEYTPHAIYRLAELYFEQAKFDYLNETFEYESKIVAFDKGEISIEPVEPVQHFEKVIALEQRLISQFPDYENIDGAYYVLGYCLGEQDELEQANNIFKELVQNRPKSIFLAEAYTRIGEYYFETSQLKEAIAAYKGALPFKTHQLYDKVLYKLAWTYYRIDNYDLAVKYFTDLIDFYESTGTIGGDLEKEAFQYLAISFAEEGWGSLDKLLSFYKKLGGRKYINRLLNRYAEVLFDATKYEESVRTFKLYLKNEPLDPEAPKIQSKIITAYERIRDFASATKEREILVANYDTGTKWYEANKDDTSIIKDAINLTNKSIYTSAIFHHQQAQIYTKQGEKEKATAEYKEAAKSYGEYLNRFPDAEESYELSYFYADALYYSGNFEKSANVFLAVRDSEKDSKYKVQSAEGAFFSYEGLIKIAQSEKKLEQRTYDQLRDKRKTEPGHDKLAPKKIVPEEIPELWKKYISASEFMFGEVEKSDLTAKVAYKGAEVYFLYRHYEEARKRFIRIIEDYPSHQVALFAANMIIDSYSDEKNFTEIVNNTKNFLEKGLGKNDPKYTKTMKDLYFGSLFSRAQYYMEEEKWEEAANEYVALVDENRNYENADKALNNAAVSYEKVRKYDSAVKTYERILKDYPKSTFADEAVFLVAVNSDKNLDFEKAVKHYKILVRNYQKSLKRKDAQYNVGQILEWLQRYREASAEYQRYANMFSKEKDASTVFFRSAVVLEKAKDFNGMLRTFNQFIRKYGAKKEEQDKVMFAYFKIAEITNKQAKTPRQKKNALKTYQTIINEFDRRAIAPGTPPAEFAAQAKFLLAEKVFEQYENVKIGGKGKKLANSLKAKAEMRKKVLDEYKEVLKYKRETWTLASAYRLGNVDQKFAYALFDAPVPPGLDDEAADIYKMTLEDMAIPIEDRAVEAYEKAYLRAKEAKIENEWTSKTLESLNYYMPDKYPVKKKPKNIVEDTLFSSMGVATYIIEPPKKKKEDKDKKDKPESAEKLEEKTEVGDKKENENKDVKNPEDKLNKEDSETSLSENDDKISDADEEDGDSEDEDNELDEDDEELEEEKIE